MGALQRALLMLQDAEQFSGHLTGTKEASLLESRSSLVECLWQLQQYPEAIETTQRMIDYLQASADPNDPALTTNYLELVQTYSRENDWNDQEIYLLLAWGACDKRIGHLSGLYGADAPMRAALSDKDLTLYWLVMDYQHEGKADQALATAEEMFKYLAENSRSWGELGPYPRREVAKLALQIATQANQRDSINMWQQRLANLR